MTGHVKRLVADRGFGFIAGTDGEDRFFHLTDLEDPAAWDALVEGAEVSFEPAVPKPAKGARALDVVVVASIPAAPSTDSAGIERLP